LLTRDNAHRSPCQLISETTPKRNVPCEGTHAENEGESAGLGERRNCDDVIRMVLAIGVRGHNNAHIRLFAKNGVYARLERSPFPEIDRMTANPDLRSAGDEIESSAVLEPATVIDNDNRYRTPGNER
jgi:hypothetical protein